MTRINNAKAIMTHGPAKAGQIAYGKQLSADSSFLFPSSIERRPFGAPPCQYMVYWNKVRTRLTLIALGTKGPHVRPHNVPGLPTLPGQLGDEYV